jgi:hypothetical protein
MILRQAAREIAWLCERRPGQDQAGVRRPSAPIRIRSPPMSTISVPPVTAGGAIGVVGTPSSLRFRSTAATESGNRRASRLGRQWLNDLLRRGVQEQRERAERERIRAEAARLATIEEGCLKPVLGGWVEQLQKFRSAYPRPRPSDARRKPGLSPAGEVADKGRKWGGCLRGSFEIGKRK